MIEIRQLSKKYGENAVFTNINLEFPSKGLVFICGPSGCGKSTLLRIIAGMDNNYEGKVIVDRIVLNTNNEEQLRLYRANKTGMVFQDHNLFKIDTASENVRLPLEMKNKYNRDFISRQTGFSMSKMNIKKHFNKIASNLSGGEAQRVAIARALITNPPILLCDEPTAALDSKNSENVFSILKEQSLNRLVIVVTHNRELANQFSSNVIEFSENHIGYVSDFESSKSNMMKMETYNVRIPHSYSLRTSYRRLRTRKWRFFFCNAISSIGFIALGLSLILSSSISKSLSESITDLAGDNYVIGTKRVDDFNGGEAVYLNKIELTSIAENFKEKDIRVGVIYENNLDSLVKDENKAYISAENLKILVPSIGFNAINKYSHLNVDEHVYPKTSRLLEEDEVVLGLSKADVLAICYQLDLFPRIVERIGDYLFSNTMQVILSVRNNSWDYSDQQILSVVGVREAEETGFIHSMPYWNEWMIEERMRFPTDENEFESLPWRLLKKYYLEQNADDFLDFVINSQWFDNVHVIRLQDFRNRYLVVHKGKSFFNLSDVKRILQSSPELSAYILASSSGYLIMPDSIATGFASEFLISSSEKSLDEVIDSNQRTQINSIATYKSDVILGNIANLSSTNLKFSSELSNLTLGQEPSGLLEIVISSKLAISLYGSEKDALNRVLSTAYVDSFKSENDLMLRSYKKSTLKIVGIKKASSNIIFQNPTWTIRYFNEYLNANPLSNQISNIAFPVDKAIDINFLLETLNKKYSDIKFTCPSLLMINSIKESTKYVEYAFAIFSLIAMGIAVILISLVIHLYMLENKLDARIILSLGGNRKDVKKMFAYQVFLMMIFSMIISTVSLTSLTLLFNQMPSEIIAIKLDLTEKPFLAILLTGVVISWIIIKSSINKRNLYKKS